MSSPSLEFPKSQDQQQGEDKDKEVEELRVKLLVNPSQVRFIEYLENVGFRFECEVQELETFNFLFILESVVTVSGDELAEPKVEKCEDLFGIRQYPPGAIEAHRLYDILDRIGDLLSQDWVDWTTMDTSF